MAAQMITADTDCAVLVLVLRFPESRKFNSSTRQNLETETSWERPGTIQAAVKHPEHVLVLHVTLRRGSNHRAAVCGMCNGDTSSSWNPRDRARAGEPRDCHDVEEDFSNCSGRKRPQTAGRKNCMKWIGWGPGRRRANCIWTDPDCGIQSGHPCTNPMHHGEPTQTPPPLPPHRRARRRAHQQARASIS